MARVSLTGGFYRARSIIANAQRCVNLFPEANPAADQAPVQYTTYPTPGLTKIIQPSIGCVRGAYRATNGALYMVIGREVYFIDLVIDYGYTLLGTIGAATTPVSFADNGTTVVLVDGSATGYWWPLGTTVIHTIVDAAFYGANFVAYLDGFFIFNRPGTNQFYISPSFWNGTDPFDALDIASKIGGPDQIVAVAVVHRDIWLIGQITTEVWYNSGGADFPFERLPGVFLDHGMLRGWSIAQADEALLWLGRDRQGQCIVFQGRDYAAIRISTHAIENEIQSYAVVNDAVGFTYQDGGHTFYVLTFPSADKTWCYDLSTGLWHERSWLDSNGVEHRSRVNCAVNAYNIIVAGDWQNGKVYRWDMNAYTDDGDPIMRRRSLPHLVKNSNQISYDSVTLDMQVGTATGLLTDESPKVLLRWSDTRGASWGDTIEIDWGSTGEYERSLIVRSLGIARDRVFEVSWSFPYQTAFQGCWLTVTPCET